MADNSDQGKAQNSENNSKNDGNSTEVVPQGAGDCGTNVSFIYFECICKVTLKFISKYHARITNIFLLHSRS